MRKVFARSTCHGIPDLADEALSVGGKLIWSGIFLLSIIVVIWQVIYPSNILFGILPILQISQLLNYALEEPHTSTNTFIVNNSEPIEFPYLVVCNFNRANKSKVCYSTLYEIVQHAKLNILIVGRCAGFR